MSNYELITNAIRLAPLLIMILVGLSLIKKKAVFRVPVIFLAGWLVMIAITFVYWHYAIEYAPSEEIRYELTLKDGGAKTGSLFFGWFYSLIFVLIFEVVRASMKIAGSILRKSNQTSVVDAKDAQHN